MLTFTTTVWVVDRVHRCTANSRTDPFPALTSCFSFDAQVVFWIGNSAKSGSAIFIDHAHFAGRHAECGIAAAARHKLSRKAGRTDKFTAFSGMHFDIADRRTERHKFQFHAAADTKGGSSLV